MNDPNEKSPIAADLKTRRKRLGLTQQELAELAGVSVRFVHELESGKPTVQLVKVSAVARVLGCELVLASRSREGDR